MVRKIASGKHDQTTKMRGPTTKHDSLPQRKTPDAVGFARMEPNPKNVRASAHRLQKAQREARAGRETTGVTAVVRALRSEIERLRFERVTWANIAAALAEHGLVQGGESLPLTATRLTAIYSQVCAQEQRRKEKEQKRHGRQDVAAIRDRAPLLTLASELTRSAGSSSPLQFETEEQIREQQLKSLRNLMKKD
jgi:hypothetical protein